MSGQSKGSRKLGRNTRVNGNATSTTRYVASGGPARNWRRNVAHCTRFVEKPSDEKIATFMDKWAVREYLDTIRCSIRRPCPIHVIARERARL